MSVYCRWCGKHRPKLSGFQKRTLAGDLVEICTYCKRYHERVQMNNPFGGLLHDVSSNLATPSILLKGYEAKLRDQKRRIAHLEGCLRAKNLELDALHYIWCDGGCQYGAHRWTEQTITEDIVKAAEANTKRLRTWWASYQHRNKMGWNTPRDAPQASGDRNAEG